MDALAPRTTVRHTTIRTVTTNPIQFIDMTDEVLTLVADARIQTGFVNVQSVHTTTAVVINEHEPLLLDDAAAMLERIAPRGASYRHDDTTLRTVNCVAGERPNGHSHCRALLLPSAVCLNVVNGRLQLGRWQRIFLVELDGPRSRDVSVLLFGDGER
jgi:secondary thiamine-phosphate synthase enzyme